MSAARRRHGYVLLAVLVLLLVLGIVVLMTIQLGGSERRAATVERDRAQALALAETGLQRTEALLVALAENNVDLDRALDPGANTTCANASPVITFGGTRTDDFLPPFTDGASITAGPAGLSWTRVDSNGGSYFVRIDDDADDADPAFGAAVTGNTGACIEGTASVNGQNPVRDRNRTVIVTSVGVFPGNDTTRPKTTRVVKARFAPPNPAGLAARGDVDMGGAAHVCGAFASVQTTGSVLDSCLCGTSCPGANPCTSNDVCDAIAAGPTCNTSGSGGGGTCSPNQPPPPIPRVSPWDVRNTPPPCTAAPCTPFYYLLWNGTETQVYLWNYGGTPFGGGSCADPAAWARVCHPNDTTATCKGGNCWQLSYQAGNGGGNIREVRLNDGAGFGTIPPPVIAPSGANHLVWETREHDDPPGEDGAGCGTVVSPAYPWATGGSLGWNGSPRATFRVVADGSSGERLPRGVWFVEGNVEWHDDSESCGALPGGWALSVIALGDLTFEEDASFIPAARRPVAAVAGRDLEIRTGNTDVVSCTSGAFLVHEQFTMGGNMTLDGQLIVDDVGHCSDEVSGIALQMHGTAAIFVTHPPPIAIGPALMRRSWAEASW